MVAEKENNEGGGGKGGATVVRIDIDERPCGAAMRRCGGDRR